MKRPSILIAGATIASFFYLLSFCICASFADMVILKNGERIKGLILDEFKDRIVFSTSEGEKTILKSRLRSIIYDSEEKILIKRAENKLKKEQHLDAYYIYEKVLELDPDNEEARKRLQYLRNYLETKIKSDIIRGIEADKERLEGPGEKSPHQRIIEELGLTLICEEKYVLIEKVENKKLSGAKSKLEPSDRIVSVWGQMVSYMDADEVAEVLLSSAEVRFKIERTVAPELSSVKTFFSKYKSMIGANLALTEEGVVISGIMPEGPFALAGVEEGDILRRIRGKNTRYMPIADIISIIEENQNERVEIVFQRDITLWKE